MGTTGPFNRPKPIARCIVCETTCYLPISSRYFASLKRSILCTQKCTHPKVQGSCAINVFISRNTSASFDFKTKLSPFCIRTTLAEGMPVSKACGCVAVHARSVSVGLDAAFSVAGSGADATAKMAKTGHLISVYLRSPAMMALRTFVIGVCGPSAAFTAASDMAANSFYSVSKDFTNRGKSVFRSVSIKSLPSRGLGLATKRISSSRTSFESMVKSPWSRS